MIVGSVPPATTYDEHELTHLPILFSGCSEESWLGVLEGAKPPFNIN